MSEAPAFQFYARDFYMGTLNMSAAARGCYISMLAASWIHGPVQDNPNAIAKAMSWGPMDPPFAGLWAEIQPKWELGPNGWINERLERTRAEQAAYRQERARRGSLGGQAAAIARAQAAATKSDDKHASTSTPPAQAVADENPSSSPAIFDLHSSTSTSGKAKTPRTKRADPVPCEGFDEFWLAYPLKVQKLDAIRAWNALAPTPAQREFIGAALIWQRPSLTFEKDGQIKGTFPATWLNGRRWEDERPAAVPVASKPIHSVSDIRYLARQLGPGSWASECMRLHGGTCGDPQTHEQRSAVAS